MTKTNVAYIDCALAALNVAKSILDEDAMPIIYLPEEREVEFECVFGESNRELDAFLNLTCEAADTVNAWLAANPGMVLANDHVGRWVAIHAA